MGIVLGCHGCIWHAPCHYDYDYERLGICTLDHDHGGILHILPGTHHDDNHNNDNNHNNHNNHKHDYHDNDICGDIHEPTGHPGSQPGFGKAH